MLALPDNLTNPVVLIACINIGIFLKANQDTFLKEKFFKILTQRVYGVSAPGEIKVMGVRDLYCRTFYFPISSTYMVSPLNGQADNDFAFNRAMVGKLTLNQEWYQFSSKGEES